MWPALVVFACSYLVIAGARLPWLALDRPGAALAGAVGMLLVGAVSPSGAMHHAINGETLLLLFGMMLVSAHLADANLFRWTSWMTLTHVRGARPLLVALVFVSGILSALLVNDTVCVMLTPLVVQLARDAGLRPLPLLLALAFGSNAGSVATPTGNPQNMLVATESGISYARFTSLLGLPALVSLVVVAAVLLVAFRHDLPPGPLPAPRLARPEVRRREAVVSVVVLAGIVVAFLGGASLAWTAVSGGTILLVFSGRPSRGAIAQVDWNLLVFFAGLFIIVYGVGAVGIAGAMFDAVKPLLGETVLSQAGVFGAFTVLASQVVSNVPFVLLAAGWMDGFSAPEFMWLSTALFSTLAGNLTPVGSVANIIVLESAGADGKIPFLQFLRFGATVTALTLAAGFGLLWLQRTWGWL